MTVKQGTISAFKLFQFCLGVAERRLTGCLVATDGQAEITAYFRSGELLETSSSHQDHQFLSFLVSEGIISSNEAEEGRRAVGIEISRSQAEQEQRLSAELYQWLVDESLLSALRQEALSHAHRGYQLGVLLSWSTGRFEWHLGERSPIELVPLTLSDRLFYAARDQLHAPLQHAFFDRYKERPLQYHAASLLEEALSSPSGADD